MNNKKRRNILKKYFKFNMYVKKLHLNFPNRLVEIELVFFKKRNFEYLFTCRNFVINKKTLSKTFLLRIKKKNKNCEKKVRKMRKFSRHVKERGKLGM